MEDVKSLCSSCPFRATCLILCPEAEQYASQDHVPQREQPVNTYYINPMPETRSNTHLSKREKEVVTLLGKGLTRRDVCEILNITRENLRNILARLKRKYYE
jgi:DNA-binding NarL/FixJ family response regulator